MEKLKDSEKLEKGYMKASTIVEIIGKPKEHVIETFNKYLEAMKKDEDLEILEVKSEEPMEMEDQKGIFSTFAEIELWAKNVNKLIGFCFDYMPSSIEVIEPETTRMTNQHITDMLNVLQARLHHTDMLANKMYQENQVFNKSLNVLSRNLIMLALGKKERDMENLEKITGIPSDKLKLFLDKMVEEKLIKEEEGKYSLVK